MQPVIACIFSRDQQIILQNMCEGPDYAFSFSSQEKKERYIVSSEGPSFSGYLGLNAISCYSMTLRCIQYNFGSSILTRIGFSCCIFLKCASMLSCTIFKVICIRHSFYTFNKIHTIRCYDPYMYTYTSILCNLSVFSPVKSNLYILFWHGFHFSLGDQPGISIP